MVRATAWKWLFGGSVTSTTSAPSLPSTCAASSSAAFCSAPDPGVVAEGAAIADAQSRGAVPQRRAVIRHRHVGRARVARVVAGQHLHHQRAVLDGPGQRPGSVEA